ncbi:MAG: purine-nucleoside phosphorylase [Anaerolineae bacterium]|nr:purine-nucleoside phosphorylase [Anaerolineae bacterium]
MPVSPYLTRKEIAEAAQAIRQWTDLRPAVGLILGSGLSPLADEVEDAVRVPYPEIPHFVRSTVEGHEGELVLGTLAGQPVCTMRGRFHYYEGYTMQQVTFPVRVMHELGAHTLVVTNAAGGLNPAFRPGDLMLIRDHINLVGMTGLNPLIGPNDDTLGPRFPDMSCAYDPGLRQLAREVAQAEAVPMHEGVYICLSGPTYETPADLRFLRLIGADAVGMSTVPEVIVARHMDMAVLGISGISNVAAVGTEEVQKTSHEEVLAAAKLLVPRLRTVIRGVLARMPKHPVQ